MPDYAHFDLETASVTDLEASGVDRYAEDPSTRVWCMANALGNSPVNLWAAATKVTAQAPEPTAFLDHIENGGAVYAHNIYFDQTVYNAVLRKEFPHWPLLRPEQCYCTMAMAYALALPGSLDKLAQALGMEYRKDQQGYLLMRRMARPRSNKNGILTWWDDDAEKFDRLYAYCCQDVVVEREAHARLFNLTPSEREVWLLDYKINKRGIRIDMATVLRANELAEAAKAKLNAELCEITNGAVQTADQTANLRDFLGMSSVAKEHVTLALEREDLPPLYRRVLEIRQAGGKTSNAKLPAMTLAAQDDNRARGMYGYHVATTGRWGGRRVQPQNLPRPSFKFPAVEKIIEVVRTSNSVDGALDILELCYGPTLECLSSSLRSLLIADDDKDLLSSDFSNIEGRVLSWIAGEEWKLEAFKRYDAGTGPDLYKITASGILQILWGRDVTPNDIDDGLRQMYGKVPDLALGFSGGHPAFQAMGKAYGTKVLDEGEPPREGWLSFEDVESIKNAWRAKHPKTVDLWWSLERAAVGAVLKPGTLTSIPNGMVRYKMHQNMLFCRLPSGRKISYPKPHVIVEQRYSRKTGKPYEKHVLTYEGEDSFTKQLCRLYAKPAVLTENVVSGTARDQFVGGMKRLERAGYPIVMHSHDELIAEVPKEFGSVEEFERIMCATDPWAAGLPVAAGGGWRGKRYRKG